MQLAGEPVSVRVPVPAAPEAAAGSVGLVVDGIDAPGGSRNPYEVYLNLPGADAATQESPHFVGFLDFFGTSLGPGSGRRAFDITSSVRQLEAAGHWDPEAAEVTFMPGRVLGGGVPEEAQEQALRPVGIREVRLTLD